MPVKNQLIFLMLSLVTPTALSAEAETYLFGVVPQQSASTLAQTWGPLLSDLSKELGVEMRFKTAPNIPEFEKQLEAGVYDFAYMNPHHFVVFNNSPGYRALAKARDKSIVGIVVKHKAADIFSLEQLENSTLAFPSPAAFAASVLPRAEFKKRNINITPRYVSSHDSVCQNVARGLFPAGGGVIRTLRAADKKFADQLEILWFSEGYTPHAIAAHPRISEYFSGRLLSVLVDLENSDTGNEHLGRLKIKGWESAEDSDWDDIRDLGIGALPTADEIGKN